MLTYSEYFQATASPLGVGTDRDLAYQTIYGYFAEDADTPTLLGRLLDLFEAQTVGALGIFLIDTFGRPRLQLVHGLRKYPGPLTLPITNKGKAFGYLDDIKGDAGELVLVDAALLEQAPDTMVLSLDRHLDVIKHAHHSHIIPMIIGEDPRMEAVTPYKACFIPFELVPLLLGKGLNPVQALNVIHPFLDNLNLSQPSKWEGEPGLTLYMRNQVLYWDLPGLKHPIQPAPVVDPTLAATLTALTDQQLKLSEGLDQRRPPATVKNTWGPFSRKPICPHLPSLGLEGQAMKDPHDLPEPTPLVTTAALKKFQDGNFHGTDPFDVADGILPLAFTPPWAQDAAATVAAYDTMISTEGNSLTLKDSLKLQKTKAYLPVEWTKATTQLESYLAVLATILEGQAREDPHDLPEQGGHMRCRVPHPSSPGHYCCTQGIPGWQLPWHQPVRVADGILPLAFTPPGGSAASLKREQEAAATIAAYDTIISTEGNFLTLKDSLELQKTKAYLPIDWTEATTQLESYLAVLATILGLHHPAVQSYQKGLMKLKLQQMPLCRAIADELGELITPAIVIYYFQIRDFQAFRITQNLHWLINVSNLALAPPIQALPGLPQAPARALPEGPEYQAQAWIRGYRPTHQ
eukprot:jgi/Psemu1/23979/gm1.23979_g